MNSKRKIDEIYRKPAYPQSLLRQLGFRVRRNAGDGRARRALKKAVRFMFGEELYEVAFYGNVVDCVWAIRHGVTAGGVQEMRRPRWDRQYQDWHWSTPLDPAVVDAARLALESGESAVGDHREDALARLQQRRAKLAREIEMIDATIASM
jgi:hypothetical protein